MALSSLHANICEQRWHIGYSRSQKLYDIQGKRKESRLKLFKNDDHDLEKIKGEAQQ